MKTQSKFALILFAAAAATPGLVAQTQNAPAPTPAGSENESTIVLSPFEVSATKDTGYQATETLAGTRIRTDLKDVASAITVVTKEFLQDIGATDNSTLLQYTPSAEVAGTHGTYAGLGNGTDVNESGSLRAPAGAQRVRGLDAADNARDFYITDIPWDSYNVDRIDIQRGPNSILFGLGSPAGMVNASLRGAEFRNMGNVEYRVGSYSSQRSSIDLNQVLIDKVLSIRVDGLWDAQRYEQRQAWQNTRRIYGAIRFEPQLFKDPSFRTSIKVKYEHGDIDADRPRTVTPNDSITAWFRGVNNASIDGGMGKLAVENGYDAWRTDNVVVGGSRGLVQSSTANYQPWLSVPPNQQQPFWLIDGTTNELYRVEGGYINVGARNNAGGFTGASNGLIGKRTMDQFYGLNSLGTYALNAHLPNSQYGQYKTASLTDSSVFDFYHNLIDGPTKSEMEKWDAYNVDLQQTFWNDRLGVQLTYDRQKYKNSADALLGTPTITLDVLKNFADFYVTGASGSTTTNPNFGRPYVFGAGGNGGSSYVSDRKVLRGSIFGEVRASDYFKGEFLQKLLGKHRFNGVYSSEKYFTENRSWQDYANSREWAGYWNGTDGTASSFKERPPLAFIYLGSSVASRTSASGANIPGISANVALPDAGVHVMDPTWLNFGTAFNAPWNVPTSLYKVFNGLPNPESTTQLTQASNPDNYVGWTYFQDHLLRYNNGQDNSLLTKAVQSMRETTSYAGSWQGFLWNESIIPTLGWRYDEVKGKGVTAASVASNRAMLNLQPNVYKLPDVYPANQIFKDHSTSGGVVVHLNKLLPTDILPINVSVSYDKSNNFQVTDTRRDIYGNPIGNPNGTTKDYGVLLSTKDGKYSFRAIKYETAVFGANSQLSNPTGLGTIVQQMLKWRNVFLYKLGAYDWSTRESVASRNSWGPTLNPATGTTVAADNTLTFEQGRSLEDASIRAINDAQKWLTDKGFFSAWGFTPQPVSVLTDRTTFEANPSAYTPPDVTLVNAYTAVAPQGFTVTADTQSKGYEFELTANPLPNWRIAFNASKATAVRNNVGGPGLQEYIDYIDALMAKPIGTVNGRAYTVGDTPQFGNTSLSLYANVWAGWRGNYTLMKLQEGTAASELRKWRYNVITNYTFRHGFLKNVGIGGSYRWQDKVTIGYPTVPLTATTASFDLTQPYFGPAEDALDVWASYERKITDKINWRIQLNVRNVGANDGLIPISIQPDGKTWASVRVKPVQDWFVTNTFSF
ncbi:MAG TPA: TonB-dependent receptor plug domain-containing protein [Lacunisphaera sp.]|nr:TonB-dependent receptor plug domain-containing protein [Lacunisphaera sp.]